MTLLHNKTGILRDILLAAIIFGILIWITAPVSAADTQKIPDPSPPKMPVKLLFIHHSVGENWLSDENGGLGEALFENNYFVSDTYYGWGPDAIGDRTDIPDWVEWFKSPQTNRYMQAAFLESDDDAAGWDYYNRPMQDPGGENEIIIFKSCYPNSDLEGNPGDPAGFVPDYSVSGAKYVYNQILSYFATRPDKLFVAITAPPELDGTYADNARAFNTWLTTEWLNGYDTGNVAVWDLYTVLTGSDNHHRFLGGTIEYITDRGGNTLVYPTEDPHPSSAGNRKATAEFVPMLNIFYNQWKEHGSTPAGTVQVTTDEPISFEEESIEQVTTTPPVKKPDVEEQVLLIDDFETEPAERTQGWAIYSDGTSVLSSKPDKTNAASGSTSRSISVTPVIAGGWATTELLFDEPRNFSDTSGISFFLHAEDTDFPYSVLVYSTDPDGSRELYFYETETTAESTTGWDTVTVAWDAMNPLEGGGQIHPENINGVVFSFGNDIDLYETIYIDNLSAYR